MARTTRARQLFAVLVLSSLLHASLFAQHAAITGIVRDTSGAALPRASVRLVDATGTTRSTTLSDANGRFTIDSAGCTTCAIEAALTGFITARATVPADITAFHPSLELGVAPITDAIVVTPTRDAAPADLVGANITVFTANDIAARGTMMAADLLRESPGVAVIQSGGTGNVTSLFMRGGESSYTKVLLDGIPLNEPGGTFNFANLTTTNLARVEVVRGAQSALFGSDAMAGVVQLVTARGAASRAAQLTASVETGTYATSRGTAALNGAHDGWDYSLGAAAGTTDNRAPNNVFTNRTLSWSAGHRFNANVELRTVGRTEYGKAGAPGATAFGRPDMDAFYAHQDVVAGASLTAALSPRWSQRVSYAYTRSRQDSTNLIADPSYVPTYGASKAPFAFSDFTYDTENVLERHVANYQSTWTFTGAATQIITAAVDFDGERGALKDQLAKTVVNATRNNLGITLQHQLAGARGSLVTSGRVERNDSFGTTFVPRVSAAFVLLRGAGAIGDTTLKVNAGRGVKEPTVLQSFSPNAFFRGNPDLQPETSRTIDAGLVQRLAHDHVRLEAVWFDNRYRDLISTRTTNPATFEAQYFNIGNTRARGLELSADAAITAALRLSGGYTFTDSEVIDSTSPSSAVLKSGNTLFRRPRHSAFLRAGYNVGVVHADLDGQYVGTRVDSDFASLSPALTSSGRYWLWNASATVNATSRVSVFVRVQNLGDVDYMEPLGYPAWRRSVHTGLRLTF